MNRIGLLLPALVVLAGCEGTTFQHPPLAEQPCDSALVGNWESIGDKPSDADNEVELRIDRQCQLLFIEHEKDGDRDGTPTALHVGKRNGRRYFWLDATWANQRFKSDRQPAAGDVYVVRYGIVAKILTLELPNDKAIAHRIIDGKIHGDVDRTEDILFNRVTDPFDAAELDRPGFFGGQAARFRHRENKPKS